MSKPERIIVAAAAHFEAKELLSILNARGVPATFIEVGIGAIKSAHIAARTLELVSGRSVLFVGSCGTSDSFKEPILVNPTSVVWAPADVRHNESYLIPSAEPAFTLDKVTSKLSLQTCQVSCAGSITKRPETSPHIYENLELYSVASVWRCRTAAFWSILGITNQLGPSAHEQWKKNFAQVGTLTASFVADHLEIFLKKPGSHR